MRRNQHLRRITDISFSEPHVFHVTSPGDSLCNLLSDIRYSFSKKSLRREVELSGFVYFGDDMIDADTLLIAGERCDFRVEGGRLYFKHAFKKKLLGQLSYITASSSVACYESLRSHFSPEGDEPKCLTVGFYEIISQ